MQQILENLKITVDRLILQYREYVQNEEFLTSFINDLHPNLLAIYKKDLDQLSNEMTFKNHIVWLMYKTQAYKDTNHSINTLQDLIDHCSPIDDICTQRFFKAMAFKKCEF